MISRHNIPRFYVFVALSRFFLWMPIWVIFLERRGLSLSQIGTLELVAILLLAVSEVPTGTVADTWGRKGSMAIGSSLHGLALLGLLTEVLSPIFLVAYAIWGISFSFLSRATVLRKRDCKVGHVSPSRLYEAPTSPATKRLTAGLIKLPELERSSGIGQSSSPSSSPTASASSICVPISGELSSGNRR